MSSSTNHSKNRSSSSSSSHHHRRVNMNSTQFQDILQRSQKKNIYEYMVNGLPQPRLQWNENFGYCGETSFITAGMTKGGFWMSQYDMRNIASDGTNQAKSASQLLIGVNDEKTADTLVFNEESWNENTIDVKKYVTWLKKKVLEGNVVVIGVFMNEYIFSMTSGDDDYDHIVSVVGWGSSHPLTDLSYYADDTLILQDNGIFDDDTKIPLYQFSFTISEFLNSRKNANTKTAPIYSLNGSPSSDHPNYGIALTNEVDDDNVVLPLYIETSRNDESPDIKQGSSTRPSTMKFELILTIDQLTVGQSYNLYRYATFANVPTNSFNKNAKKAAETTTFTATNTTYSTTLSWVNDDIAIFRCVSTNSS